MEDAQGLQSLGVREWRADYRNAPESFYNQILRPHDLPAWLRYGIPNALAIARVLAAPVFPFLGDGGRLIVIVAAALSDALDGFLARRLDATSAAGEVLDAVGDKVVAATVLVTLAAEGRLPWWWVAVLLAREAALAAVLVRLGAARRWDALRRAPHRLAGKLATAAIFVLLVALLAAPGLAALHLPLFVLAAALSVLSAADYLRQFVRLPPARPSGFAEPGEPVH